MEKGPRTVDDVFGAHLSGLWIIITLVGMSLVVGYTIFAYRVFKGKAESGGDAY